MAKIPWGIVWENLPPDTQTKNIEGAISWIIKAIPDVDPMAVEPDTAIIPIITGYEILENNFSANVIVDETDAGVGVQISGDVGNPFIFQKIGYVTPKGEGFTEIVVPTVDDLPDYGTIDITAFVPSNVPSQTDTITIRATASDFDTPTPSIYQITGVFEITTNNDWTKVTITLNEILNA